MNIFKSTEFMRLKITPIIISICIIVGVLFQLWNVYIDLNMTVNVEKGSLEENISQENINELKKAAGEYHNSYIVWRDALNGYELLIVLLSCLPFASSYVVDKKTGFMNNILLRTNPRKYILSKAIFNSILGGVIAVIPSTLILIIFSTFFKNSIPTLEIYYPCGFFKNYFLTNINLYVLFFTIILFIIGMTYATLSMAIGMLTENMVLCVLGPSIFWYAGSILFETLGIDMLVPWNIYYFNVEPSISFGHSLIFTLIVFIISYIVIYIKSTMEKI